MRPNLTVIRGGLAPAPRFHPAFDLMAPDIGSVDPIAVRLAHGAKHKRDLPAFLRLVADQAAGREDKTVRLSPGFVRLLADHVEFSGGAA